MKNLSMVSAEFQTENPAKFLFLALDAAKAKKEIKNDAENSEKLTENDIVGRYNQVNQILENASKKFVGNPQALAKFEESVLNSLKNSIKNSLIGIDKFDTDTEKGIDIEEFENYLQYLQQGLDAVMKNEQSEYGFTYLFKNFKDGDFIKAKQLAIGESSNNEALNLLKNPGNLTISQIESRIKLYNSLRSSGLDNDLNDWTSTGEEARTRKQLQEILDTILKTNFNPEKKINCKFEGWESDGGANYQFFSDEITQAEFISRLLRDSSTVSKAFSAGINTQNKKLAELNKKEKLDTNEENTRKNIKGANRLRQFLSHFETWAQQEEGAEFGDKLIKIYASLNSEKFLKDESLRRTVLTDITNLMIEETDIRDKADWSWEDGYAKNITAGKIMDSDLALSKVLRAMGKTNEAEKNLYKTMQSPSAENVKEAAINEITDNIAKSLENKTVQKSARKKLNSMLKGLKNPDGSLTPEYISIIENYDATLADITINLATNNAFRNYFDKPGANPSDLGEMGEIYSDMTGLGGSILNISDENLAKTQSYAIMAASMLIPPGGGMAVIKGLSALVKTSRAVKLIKSTKTLYTFTKLSKGAGFLEKAGIALGNVAKFIPNMGVKFAKGLWKPTASFTAKYGKVVAKGYCKMYKISPFIATKLMRPLIEKQLLVRTAHFTAMEGLLNKLVAGNGFSPERFVDGFNQNLKMFAAFGITEKFAPAFKSLAKARPNLAGFLKYGSEVSLDVTAVGSLMVIEKLIDNGEWTKEDWHALQETGLMSALLHIAPHVQTKYEKFRENFRDPKIKGQIKIGDRIKYTDSYGKTATVEVMKKSNQEGKWVVKGKSGKLYPVKLSRAVRSAKNIRRVTSLGQKIKNLKIPNGWKFATAGIIGLPFLTSFMPPKDNESEADIVKKLEKLSPQEFATLNNYIEENFAGNLENSSPTTTNPESKEDFSTNHTLPELNELGNWSFTLADGAIISFSDDGTISIDSHDDTKDKENIPLEIGVPYTFENGASITRNADGSADIIYSDGTTSKILAPTAENPAKKAKTTSKISPKEYVDKNGNKVTVSKDGTTTTVFADGSKEIVYKDGTSKYIESPHKTQNSAKKTSTSPAPKTKPAKYTATDAGTRFARAKTPEQTNSLWDKLIETGGEVETKTTAAGQEYSIWTGADGKKLMKITHSSQRRSKAKRGDEGWILNRKGGVTKGDVRDILGRESVRRRDIKKLSSVHEKDNNEVDTFTRIYEIKK